MLGFEFAEELFNWPGPAFSHVLKALTNALASVRLCSDIEETLIRLRVLNNSRGLTVHGQDDRALAFLDLF